MEREVIGILPEHFMKMFEDPIKSIRTNRRINKVELLATEELENGTRCTVIASHMLPPSAFISGRIFIGANYLYPEHSIVISSSRGNDRYQHDYLAAGRNEGKTPANNRFSGHWYQPLLDPLDPTKVLGTKIIFVNESDFGGSFPKWIVQKLAPPGLNDFYEDLISDVK